MYRNPFSVFDRGTAPATRAKCSAHLVRHAICPVAVFHSAALRKLRDAGLLTTQQGRGSATWYKPAQQLLDRTDHPGALIG